MKIERFIIIYKKGKFRSNLEILSKDIINNNKNKVKFIFNNKRYNFKELIDINVIKENKIKIFMIINYRLYNRSYMFKNCKLLSELYIDNINNDANINFDYSSICERSDFPSKDIKSKDDEKEHPIYKNLKKTNYEKILENSEIKKNNLTSSSYSTISVLNNNLEIGQNNRIMIYGMFYNCESILFLPDISEWNIDDVTDMSYLF